jgi:hypothetical protein
MIDRGEQWISGNDNQAKATAETARIVPLPWRDRAMDRVDNKRKGATAPSTRDERGNFLLCISQIIVIMLCGFAGFAFHFS